MTMLFIAGETTHAAMLEQRAALMVGAPEYGYGRSEHLCRAQSAMAGRGYVGVHIVQSMYGYSVRYDSGLQNFSLLHSARSSRDPSFEAAAEFCRRWVAVDPERRYAWYTVTEVTPRVPAPA